MFSNFVCYFCHTQLANFEIFSEFRKHCSRISRTFPEYFQFCARLAAFYCIEPTTFCWQIVEILLDGNFGVVLIR